MRPFSSPMVRIILAGAVAANGLLLQAAATPASAGGLSVPADVVAIFKGGEILMDANPWPGLTIRVTVHLAGIEVPTLDAACDAERGLSKEARSLVEDEIGSYVTLSGVREGPSAGSVFANVETQWGRDLAQILIDADLGRPFDGGTPRGWCS